MNTCQGLVSCNYYFFFYVRYMLKQTLHQKANSTKYIRPPLYIRSIKVGKKYGKSKNVPVPWLLPTVPMQG